MARTHQLTRSQFVAVQMPLVDLRLLIGHDTGRLVRPSWPDPDVGREFLRGVGAVRPLYDLKEPRAWRRPQPFIDATSFIRFPPAWNENSQVWIKPIHRRLLSTGITWRVDIGLVTKWREKVGPRNAVALAHRIIDLPLRISREERPLKNLDQILIEDLLRRTTRVGCTAMKWWMSSGLPLLIIDELDTRRTKLSFSVAPVISNNRPMPTFVIRRREYHVEQVRLIRTELCRTYHQLETLRLVLRAWRIHQSEIDVKLMRDFLASELNRLSRRSKKGNFQPDVIGIAAAATDFPTSDLAVLAKDLQQESKGLTRQLENLARVLDDPKQQKLRNQPINCTVTLERLEMNSGDNFTFNDRAAGVFGHNNTTHSSKFIAGDNLVSSSIELRSLLDAIAILKPQLESSMSNDLEVAAVEVVEAEEPEKIRAALQKVAGIATMAGTAGAAVIEAVKLVAATLAIGQ